MITTTTRIILIAAAFVALIYIVRQINKSRLVIRDSLFWVFFSALLLFMAVFPDLLGSASALFGIETPSNLLYLLIIGLMLIRIYKMSIRISILDTKVKELTQSLSIQEKELIDGLENKKSSEK